MTSLWWSLALVLLATLSPAQWTEAPGRPPGPGGGLSDILLNVALFVPLGVGLARAGRSVPRALLFGTLLSGAVELAQLWVPGRVPSLRDVAFNAVGTVVGWSLWRSRTLWMDPSPRVAGRLALGAATATAAIVALTGWLLAPDLPGGLYFGHWTPEFGGFQVYRGHVLEASVGATPIPLGPIAHSRDVQKRLIAREALRVRAVAGPRVDGLAPLLSISDPRRELVLLGVDGEDLLYRVRTRAASMGLDNPELRISGALRGIRASDPLMIAVRPDGDRYCIEVNAALTCGVGFSAAAGWAFFLSDQVSVPALHGLFSTLWLAGLVLPLGYWARADWVTGLAVAALAAALFLVPTLCDLVPPDVREMAGVVAGLVAGAWLGLWQRGALPSITARRPRLDPRLGEDG